MKRNEEIREKVLRVLKRAKKPLSRDQIWDRITSNRPMPDRLPLAAMQREGTIERIGSTRDSKYLAVRA